MVKEAIKYYIIVKVKVSITIREVKACYFNSKGILFIINIIIKDIIKDIGYFINIPLTNYYYIQSVIIIIEVSF